MFKKPFKISAQNQLSGRDRKSLRTRLAELMNPVAVDALLGKNDKLISGKLSGCKTIILLGEQYPLFVDANGKQDYFPTVYACQACPGLVRMVILFPGVEGYIFNGANLMWPGVSDATDLVGLKRDEVVAIYNDKRECIAVGTMATATDQAGDKSGVAVNVHHYVTDKLWESGPKAVPKVLVDTSQEGKEAKEPTKEFIKQAPKELPKEAPTKEKTQIKQVKEVLKEAKPLKGILKQQKPDTQSQEQETTKPSKRQKREKAGKQKNKAVQEPQEQAPPPAQEAEEQQQSQPQEVDLMSMISHLKPKAPRNKGPEAKKIKFEDDDEQDARDRNKKGKKKNKAGGGGAKKNAGEETKPPDNTEETEQPKSAISGKLMDQYFKEAMLNAIKLAKLEGQLPIDSGRFYSEYISMAAPEGIKLDIKQSTYKKLNKFYEDMADRKIIEFKHIREKKGQPGATINKIFWENEELTEHVPTIRKLGEREQEGKDEPVAGQLKLTQSLRIEPVYKLDGQMKGLLIKTLFDIDAPTPVGPPPELLLSEKEVREKIEAYIDTVIQNDPDHKKTKKIAPIYEDHPFIAEILSAQLDDHFNNAEIDEQGKKKKAKVFRVERSLLLNKILKKCHCNYRIVDPENDVNKIINGTFKGISIVAQKIANRNITRVSGLQQFIVPQSECQAQLTQFAGQLQKQFACSVNVQNGAGKNSGKQLLLHGTFIDELQDMFTGQYGLSKEYIATQSKMDKRKKN